MSGLTKHAAPSTGGDALRQARGTCWTLTQAVLGVHRPAEQADRLAEQGLGRRRRTGTATTTPPPWLPTGIDSPKRLAIARITAPGRHGRRHRRSGARIPSNVAAVMSAPPKEQPEVGRVDRGGVDPDQHLVVGRLRRRNVYQRKFEFAALLEQRTQLKPALAVAHRTSPPIFVLVISGYAEALRQCLQRRFAGVDRLLAELLFDAQELVVLGDAVGAAEASRS